MQGSIVGVDARLHDGRLRVEAVIRTDAGESVHAFLPDREVSALVPRCVLVGSSTEASSSLMETIAAIAQRLGNGRRVRVWMHGEHRYCAFASWRSVRFF